MDMKKWLVFLGGLMTGVVLTLAVLFVIGRNVADTGSGVESATETEGEKGSHIDGVTYFDEPGDIINEKSVRVIQVVADDAALVMGGKGYIGTVYAITNRDNKYYYDDEIIKLPKGKVFRQVGIYRYPTKNEMIKTVPIIVIMDE